jgi:cob(I)alamin adenosyltransferase
MKIYTKTGDDGTTGLFNGSRVLKSSLRVETYGTVDELNSIIGLITTQNLDIRMLQTFTQLNNLLFNLGSDLATPLNPKPKFDVPRMTEANIIWLENLIDEYDNELSPLKNFILPGGTVVAAYLHNARTVCRRAERLAVRMNVDEDLGLFVVKFLNRLSDFLFTAARMANHLAGVKDVEWKKD